MAKASLRSLTDAQLRGKRALVRVDFNVPLDARRHITDDTRMRAAVPTIEYLLSRGARVVLLSHFGRPKGKPEPQFSLAPVARHLNDLLPQKVAFSDSLDLAALARSTAPLVLVENTRFFPGEEKNDDALARQFAQLGDLFVNNAFGAAHRAHASTEGVAHHLHPAVAGLLMERELDYLGRALDRPDRPFVSILGGAKISGKIDVLEALLPKVDGMLVGGAMASTFFRAMGLETGTSLVEPDRVEMAQTLLERWGPRLTLPHDVMVAPSLECAGHGPRREAGRHSQERSGLRHRSRVNGLVQPGDSVGAHRVVERPDGRVREIPIRRRDQRHRRSHGHGHGARRDDDRRRRGFGGGGGASRSRYPNDPRLDRRRRFARVSRRQGAARCGGARRRVSAQRILAANWKMHLGPQAALAYMQVFLEAYPAPLPGRTVVFAPPAASLSAVANAVRGRSDLTVGAQNIHWEEKGALTGEMSGLIAREAGAAIALVGHSERRRKFGETDADTARKCAAAVRVGLTPMLCVGETDDERQVGRTSDVVARQLRAGLSELSPDAIRHAMVAYEPVWAIGTGRNATPEDAALVHAFLRTVLAELVGEHALGIPILYGGSVSTANCRTLLSADNVDGLLVGGASLDPIGWAEIART